MTITLNGTTGITTPDVTSDGLTVDSTTLVVDEVNNRVGVGTGIPIAPVDIYTETGTEAKLVIRNHTATSPVASIELRRGEDSANFGTDIYGDYRIKCADGALIFDHGASNTTTERARINSSGNLLVGGTSDSNNCRFVVTNTDSTRTWGFGTSYENTGFYVLDNTTGVGVYVVAGATSWTGISDERYKTDLKPIENAAQKVSTLRAVTGRFKADAEGTSRSFLIAQDVQAVLPEAVDATNPDKLGLSYTDTIPLLVAAIKEQQAIIEEQKTALEALTARVSALEAA